MRSLALCRMHPGCVRCGAGGVKVVRAFVKKLRRKLGDGATSPTYIFTEPRVGYRMAKSRNVPPIDGCTVVVLCQNSALLRHLRKCERSRKPESWRCCRNSRRPRPVPKLGPFEIDHKSAA